MAGIIVRMLIIALGLGLANVVVAGVNIQGTGTLLFAALLLGLVNAIIRPIVVVLTLPLTILTLGLFLFVVNAAMFGLVAAMLDQFQVSGFFAALFGAIIVSITSMLASWFIGPNGRYEVLIISRNR
jgi:putative membrane protein